MVKAPAEVPRRAGPAPKPPPPPPPPPSPLEGADPADVFALDEPLPNFEIVGRAPPIDPKDEFLAMVPSSSDGSANFQIVGPTAATARSSSSSSGRLPAGFTPAIGTDFSPEGWPQRIVCEADLSEMVLVPTGTVMLGSDTSGSDASPAVNIEISAFYIDATEVTVGRLNRFRGAVGAKISPPLNETAGEAKPALGVLWSDAREYAHWSGRELPTEAEWERAARGPHSWRTPWGDGRDIWERPRSPRQIDDVKSFRHDRSPFGVFDMAGNAREWCADHFSPRAHAEIEAVPFAKRLDWPGPKLPAKPNQRVVKGGSPDWSLWHRAGLEMRERAADVGFRCVLRSRTDATKTKL